MGYSKKDAIAYILNSEDLVSKEDGYGVQGLCLIQNYTSCPQKNGGRYIAGRLQAKGEMQFKAWGNSLAFASFSANDCQNKVVTVSGIVNKYGGTTSLIIDSIDVPDEELIAVLSPLDFMKEVYDADELFQKMQTLITSKCSVAALEVFNKVMADVKERFKTEYAAVSHHDNVKSGLIAHTFKVMRIATIVKMYPDLLKAVSPDLLYLGCALHDIGKIFEYENGCVSQDGKKLSHHTFGVMFLFEHKDYIIAKMGEDFFYSLLSIVEQHHGEFEERPRTLAAYLIHKFDRMDSTLTSLETALSSSTDGMVVYDNFKLSF